MSPNWPEISTEKSCEVCSILTEAEALITQLLSYLELLADPMSSTQFNLILTQNSIFLYSVSKCYSTTPKILCTVSTIKI